MVWRSRLVSYGVDFSTGPVQRYPSNITRTEFIRNRERNTRWQGEQTDLTQETLDKSINHRENSTQLFVVGTWDLEASKECLQGPTKTVRSSSLFLKRQFTPLFRQQNILLEILEKKRKEKKESSNPFRFSGFSNSTIQ